jgi:D-sedoheptulose 7-phosphate isomerase
MNNMYFNEYFNRIKSSLDSVDNNDLEAVVNLIKNVVQNNKKIITVGNGGSASIANHITVDLINAANIKALSFSDAGIITCFSNDYGYENWVSKALDCYAESGDLIILISSSGQSENMLVAANKAKTMNTDVVTLSGFSSENPLRKLGDINFWVDSSEYNNIEMVHHIWLLAIIDFVIENNKRK